ncbi:MAG: 23S rRNA (guanosine(2251)-2'-O)-methyltransferase RlmB [Dissulfurispiraceae bacterium]
MNKKDNKEHWAYGINPVLEALMSDQGIGVIYCSQEKSEHHRKIISMAQAKSIPLEIVKKDFFETRFHKGHQGVAAILSQRKLLSIDELMDIPTAKGELPFFLILDCIEDPRNFGALLRVADAAGIHGIVFQSHRSAAITGIVAKTSAGAVTHVNLTEVVNVKHALEMMKKSDIIIVGAESGSPLSLWDLDMKVPLALVIGSEGQGLRRTVKEKCDFIVNIPMWGRVNSLNVSVAAGILSYEVVRQRRAVIA